MRVDVLNDPRFTKIPNTPYVTLTEDTSLTHYALKEKTILLEHWLNDLPEVQTLQLGDVFLDIGALYGETCLIPAQRRCEVHAFEVHSLSFLCLCHNCPWPNVHKYNVAVGDGSLVKMSGALGESGEGPRKNNLGTQMVETANDGFPSVRIDDLNFENVTLAKIDVEGFEVRVLEGMRETINRTKCRVLIEVYDALLAKQGFKRQDVLDFFESVDYQWRVAIGRFEDERCDLLCEPK